MNQILENAKYYTFIKDYVPPIHIILIVIFIGLACLSVYKLINSAALPDRQFSALNQLFITLMGAMILLLFLLISFPKMILEEYSNNVLKKEYKKELDEHYSFLIKNNNMNEEESNYFFAKDKDSKEYYLQYNIYLNDDKPFKSKNTNINEDLKGHIKYNIKHEYKIED